MHKRILIPSNNKNEILYLSETIIDQNFKATKHSHPNLEILFFIEGEGLLVTNYKKYNIKTNDLIIINMNTEHIELSNCNLKFYAIGLNHLKAFLQNLMDEEIIHISLDNNNSKLIKNLYSLILEEVLNKKEQYLDIINNYFDNLLIIIKRYLSIDFINTNDNNHSSIVSTLCHILDNYFYLNLKISELAKKLSLSSSSICHIFKKEMGISLIEYKIKKQIEEAKNLLIITDMTIIEICNAVGLKNSSYFSKVFKNYVGISPKEYRTNKKI